MDITIVVSDSNSQARTLFEKFNYVMSILDPSFITKEYDAANSIDLNHEQRIIFIDKVAVKFGLKQCIGAKIVNGKDLEKTLNSTGVVNGKYM